MLRETRHKMWPVDRKWALREQSMSLEEFHDLEDVDDEDEEEKGDEDVEAGCHNQNYHFSPSVIKKRGFNTLHQVAQHHRAMPITFEFGRQLTHIPRFLNIQRSQIHSR